jgi:hypothetical protein
MAEDKGFEINDKRISAGGGTAGDASAFAPGAETSIEGLREGSGRGPQEADEFPPVDFMSFVGSLAATALMHMGEKFSPDQPDDMKDLAAARQMIDLIDLLKEKTKGNLTEEEAKMMESMLYNLKMRYVQESAGK